jgi:hypothetical protein
MKRLLIVFAFLMAVLAVNAQVTRVVVKTADLPKALTENVAKNYTGFSIKEATKVTENNVVSYDVILNRGAVSETLVYDKDGKFLKKMTQKISSAEKPGHKPGAKSHPVKK